MINISRFDLNLLVVLDAIGRERSITRAGATLNLTQPAVSHALGRLRQALGDPLFFREGGQMIATPTARVVMDAAQRAIKEVEGTLRDLECFVPASSRRTFRVGMRHAVEALVVPRFVSRLRHLAPGIELVSLNHERSKVQQDLASGSLDAVVDIPLDAMPGVAMRTLGVTQLVVAWRDGHPRMSGARSMDLDAYLSMDHLLVSSRPTGPAAEDLALAGLGLFRRVAMRCANPWTALQTVMDSDLVATVHLFHARDLEGRVAGLRTSVVPFRSEGAQIMLYWSERRQEEQAVAWLRDQIEIGFAEWRRRPMVHEKMGGRPCR